MKIFRCIAAGWLMAAGVQAGQDIRGYWRFDDGTGLQVNDDSGQGNLGFAVRAEWTRGVRNSGLLFAGGDGFVNCGNDSSLCPTKGLTLEAWIKPWNLPYDQHPTVITKKGSYALRFAPGGHLSLLLNLEGVESELLSRQTKWTNGEWFHVAATFDGTSAALYVNGKKDVEQIVAKDRSLSGSKSFLFIGSVNGRTRTPGRIDEVRLAGRALSAGEIMDSYRAGAFDVEREATRFSAFFQKDERRAPKAVVPGFLWIEAEDFTDYGGWWMDTQFVPQMGSPYLIAAGIGRPVADAHTTVQIPASGSWTLWVRNRNWLKKYAPGRVPCPCRGTGVGSGIRNGSRRSVGLAAGGHLRSRKGGGGTGYPRPDRMVRPG